MTYLDGLVITLGKYVRRYRRRSIVDDNHCLVEASEWIEVGLLRTLPCFFVESLASYHGWDCILQGVCVHVMRVEGVHDGHGSVIFRYFFFANPICASLLRRYFFCIQSISGQFAGATQKSIGPPILGHAAIRPARHPTCADHRGKRPMAYIL